MRLFRILLSGMALVGWHWVSNSDDAAWNFEIPKWVSESASRWSDLDEPATPRYGATHRTDSAASAPPRERFGYANCEPQTRAEQAREPQHRVPQPVGNTGRMVQKRELSMAYGCYWRLVDDLRDVNRRQKSRELGRVDAEQARAQIAARWHEIDRALRGYNERVAPEFRVALLACPIASEA